MKRAQDNLFLDVEATVDSEEEEEEEEGRNVTEQDGFIDDNLVNTRYTP